MSVVFHGGPDRMARRLADAGHRIDYDVPKNTLDPRYAACTDHHVACDCREADLAEQLGEHRMEWRAVHVAARQALAGHQVYGRDEDERDACLCSGCAIQRATRNLLGPGDVDYRTGRVRPVEPQEVPF